MRVCVKANSRTCDQTCVVEDEAAVTAAAACEADDGSGVCITLEEEEGVQLT